MNVRRKISFLLVVILFISNKSFSQKRYYYDNQSRLERITILAETINFYYSELGNRITLTKISTSQNQQTDLLSTNTSQTPPSLPKGSSLDLFFDLQNGSEASHSNIFNQVYWSRENTLNNSPPSLKTDFQRVIDSNQTIQKQLQIILPDTLSDGPGFLIIKVDSKNLITETNEDNNTIVIPLTINNSLIPERTIEADFKASLQYICLGSTVFFDDLSQGDPTEWNWTFEGGLPATSNEQNPRVTYSEPGVYPVTLTAKDGAIEGVKEQVGFIIVEGEGDNDATTVSIEHEGSLTVCEQGSVTLKAPDGFTGYSWSNGETSQEIEVNEPGEYHLTVKKCNGEMLESEPVSVTQESFEINVLEVTQATCTSGGSVILEVSGAEDYSIVWDNGMQGLSLDDIVSGYYEATITTPSGCEKTLGVSLSQSQLPTFDLESANTSCGEVNGSLSLLLDQPENYEIEWSNGESGASIETLEPGAYWVKVTETETGCETTKSVFIESSENPIPEFEFDPKPTTCGGENGMASIEFEGIENFEIIWDGETVGNTVTGLASGPHQVVVTHIETGCSTTRNFDVGQSENTAPTFTLDLTPTSCGMANGAVTFNLSSGNNEIRLNGEAVSENLENLEAGSYTVIFENKDTECLVEHTFTIDPSEAIDDFDLGPDVTLEMDVEKYELPTPESSGSWSIGSGSNGVIEQDANTGIWYFLPAQSGRGDYELIYTATALNCEKQNSFMIKVNLVTEIEDEVYEKTGIRLYPNPSDTHINIRKDNVGTEPLISLQLVTEIGSRLVTKTYQSPVFEDSWNVEAYPSGLYFVVIETNKGTYKLKVLIKH